MYLDVTAGYYTQAPFNYERQIHSGKKVSWYRRIGDGASARLIDEGGFGGLGAITMLTGEKKDTLN